jgi:hypothetical protein
MMYGIVGFPSLPALNSGMLGSHYNCEVQRAPVNERRAPPPRCRMAERPQPIAKCDRVHHGSWSRTPPSALSNEANPPRGCFLVTSNLEHRDHIRPGHEDLKTFVPSPRAIPASIRSGKEPRRVAKFSKRTRHRKGRRSRPLAEMWVQQLPAPWKFLKPGSVNHELYPIIFPHPHIPSLSAAARGSLR